MVFDPHAEGVDEDGDHDPSVKVFTLHNPLQLLPEANEGPDHPVFVFRSPAPPAAPSPTSQVPNLGKQTGSNERVLHQSTLTHSMKCSCLEKEEPGSTFASLSSFVTITALIRAEPTHRRFPTPHSDLVKVVQSVSLAPAPLQVSQLQLQGLQAAGAQRAAEQLQEKRAGNHACQLVQQPLASCRVGNECRKKRSDIAKGLIAAVSTVKVMLGLRRKRTGRARHNNSRTQENMFMSNGKDNVVLYQKCKIMSVKSGILR